MKKILIILFLIMLIITFYQISSMYAYYLNELEGEYSNLLGVWLIKINEIDITTGENIKFDITDEYFHQVNSDKVLENKIAPGEEVYCDLLIDSTSTDVSVRYNISLDAEEIQKNKGIEIKKIESFLQKSDGTGKKENKIVETSENIFTGTIPLQEIREGYLNTVRIFIKWENYEENNEQDTEIGMKENSNINIPIQINVSQYTGEEINSYQ